MRFTKTQLDETVRKAVARERGRRGWLVGLALLTGAVYGFSLPLMLGNNLELVRLWVKRFIAE